MSRRLRTRKPTRSRVDRSDQCRSSMMKTTGAIAASRSRTPSSISNSRPCAQLESRPSSPSSCSGPRSGTSRARSERPLPTIASSSSGDSRRTRPRRASTTGAYGSDPSPRTMQPPVRTTAPSRSAKSANSLMRRVLPTPASPATTVVLLRPSRAPRSAVRSRSNSTDRPMRTGLETRVATSSIITPPCRPSTAVRALAVPATRWNRAATRARIDDDATVVVSRLDASDQAAVSASASSWRIRTSAAISIP